MAPETIFLLCFLDVWRPWIHKIVCLMVLNTISVFHFGCGLWLSWRIRIRGQRRGRLAGTADTCHANHTFPISVPAGAWRFEPCGVSRAGAEGWKAAHTELKNKYKSLPSTNSSFLHTLANSLLRNQKQTVHLQIKSWAFSVAFYLFCFYDFSTSTHKSGKLTNLFHEQLVVLDYWNKWHLWFSCDAI